MLSIANAALIKKYLDLGLFRGRLPKTWVPVEKVPADKLCRYRVTTFYVLPHSDIKLTLLGCYQRFPGYYRAVLVDDAVGIVITGTLFQDKKSGDVFTVVTYRKLGFLPKQIRLLDAKGKK